MRSFPLKKRYFKSPPGAKKKVKKRKDTTFAQIAREWGLPKSITSPKHLRFRNVPKGICWFWFARYIRARDFKKYGTCISCGQPKPYEKLQAGHFNPASACGTLLLMDEQNVNGECDGCNGFDLMHLLGYAENLDIRYGEGTAKRLRQKPSEVTKEPSKAEYLEKAAYYRKKWEELMGVDN